MTTNRILLSAVHICLCAILAFGQVQNASEKQKSSEITKDLHALLEAENKTPQILLQIAQKYEESENFPKRDYYENLIIEKYNDTAEAETVHYRRINRFAENLVEKTDLSSILAEVKNAKNAEQRERLKNEFSNGEAAQNFRKLAGMLVAYVERPQHFDDSKLGEIYLLLLEASPIFDATDETVADIIEGSLKYYRNNNINVNSKVAEALTAARVNRPNSKLNADIEKYRCAAVAEAEAKLKIIPKDILSGSLIAAQGDAINDYGSYLIQEKRLDEAEKELLKVQSIVPEQWSQSVRLKNLVYRNNLYLAELYDYKKDYDKVETYRLKHVADFSNGSFWFEDLYRKRNHGSAAGIKTYLDAIKQKLDLRDRKELLGSRIEKPENFIPFNLQTIDGKTVSSDDLKGKIMVINFWGTWCAPCVAELPDFQKLYNKYRNDKDVVILSIASDDELETVRKFIADKKYDFPVLMDNGYVGKTPQYADESAFPTTIFISRAGKVVFVKKSLSRKLFDEFNWRIEVLKEN